LSIHDVVAILVWEVLDFDHAKGYDFEQGIVIVPPRVVLAGENLPSGILPLNFAPRKTREMQT
jgi:hypothetical protein